MAAEVVCRHFSLEVFSVTWVAGAGTRAVAGVAVVSAVVVAVLGDLVAAAALAAVAQVEVGSENTGCELPLVTTDSVSIGPDLTK